MIQHFPDLPQVPPDVLHHPFLRPPDDFLAFGSLLGEGQVFLTSLSPLRPFLPAQLLDRPDKPLPDIVQQPDVVGILDLFRKDRRVDQHPFALDDPPFDQDRVGRLLQGPEKLRSQPLPHLRQRARLQHVFRRELLQSAEGLHVRIFQNAGHDLPVALVGHMLQQHQADEKPSVRGRPPDVGERFGVLRFQVVPGDHLRDAEPAVVGIKPATERKKLGEQRHGLTVAGSIHGHFSPSEMHGFWGVGC